MESIFPPVISDIIGFYAGYSKCAFCKLHLHSPYGFNSDLCGFDYTCVSEIKRKFGIHKFDASNSDIKYYVKFLMPVSQSIWFCPYCDFIKYFTNAVVSCPLSVYFINKNPYNKYLDSEKKKVRKISLNHLSCNFCNGSHPQTVKIRD
jgi:hypothetical protein